MIQKISLVLLFIGLIVSSLPAYNDSSLKDEEVGYALLQRIVNMFQEMAATGTGGREKVDSALSGLMADARQALSEKKIDSVFFYRFNRLLMIIKLTIVEDEKGILKPLIESEIERFVLHGLLSFHPSKALGAVGFERTSPPFFLAWTVHPFSHCFVIFIQIAVRP